jgi:hypothetical protein
MTLAEKIALEASKLPEDMAREVLDFILFIENKRLREKGTSMKEAPDWDLVHIDTRGWEFDREEANAR